ncbi:MAG: hypothetical protein RLY86_484 [Pseudomonadota bacterium]|jgi:hypothetical protein
MADPMDHPPPGPNPNGNAPEITAPATEEVVERFGGIRPMAGKLGIPVTTVQGWKKRGHIPASRRADILAAAAAHAVPLTDAELDRAISPQAEETEPRIIEGEVIELPPPPADSSLEAPPVAGTAAAEAPPTPPPAEAVTAADSKPAAPNPSNDRPAQSRLVDPPPAPAPRAPPPAPTSRIGAAAFVVALVALGMALFGLMRHGDLPGLTPAAPATDPAQAAALDQIRAEIAGLAQRLDGAEGAVTRLTESVPPHLSAMPDRVAELWEEIEGLREAIAARPTGDGATAPTQATTLPGADPASLRADLDALAAQVRTLAEATATARPADTDAAPSPSPSVDLAPVAAALDGLAARVSTLEQAPAATGADPARLALLEGRIDDLGARLAALTTMVNTLAADPPPPTPAGGAAGEALVIAATQLQAALVAGRPYGAELAAVRALAADLPGLAGAVAAPLDALAPAADSGLAPLVALRSRFDTLAPEIIRAERTRADAGWVDQTLGRVASLVTVRRAGGEVAGDGVEAVVARADQAVREGNLDRAVAELATLTGPAAQIAAPWLADARARVAAEAAASALTDLTIARLAGNGPGHGASQGGGTSP